VYNNDDRTRALVSFINGDTSDREHSIFYRGLPCKSLQCIRNDATLRALFPMVPKAHVHMCRPYALTKKITDHFVQCGKELRALAGDHMHPFDLIMLHMHAQDVLPVYALSAGYYGPPVALFDHSDHTFWIGSSIVDVRLTSVSDGSVIT
jgi:hypothetical protein